MKSVRDGGFCLIRSGKSEYNYELYDMKTDTFDLVDFSEETPSERKRLALILEEWETDIEKTSSIMGGGSSVELNADRTDKLKGLGYLK